MGCVQHLSDMNPSRCGRSMRSTGFELVSPWQCRNKALAIEVHQDAIGSRSNNVNVVWRITILLKPSFTLNGNTGWIKRLQNKDLPLDSSKVPPKRILYNKVCDWSITCLSDKTPSRHGWSKHQLESDNNGVWPTSIRYESIKMWLIHAIYRFRTC